MKTTRRGFFEAVAGAIAALYVGIKSKPREFVLYINGIRQKQGTGKDYTFSDEPIVWLAGPVVQPGDKIEIEFDEGPSRRRSRK